MLRDDLNLLRPYAFGEGHRTNLIRAAQCGNLPPGFTLRAVETAIVADLDAADAGYYEDYDADVAYAALHRVREAAAAQ